MMTTGEKKNFTNLTLASFVAWFLSLDTEGSDESCKLSLSPQWLSSCCRALGLWWGLTRGASAVVPFLGGACQMVSDVRANLQPLKKGELVPLFL